MSEIGPHQRQTSSQTRAISGNDTTHAAQDRAPRRDKAAECRGETGTSDSPFHFASDQVIWRFDERWITTFPKPVKPMDGEWLPGLALRCDQLNGWLAGTTMQSACPLPTGRTTIARSGQYVIATSFDLAYLAQSMALPLATIEATTFLPELWLLYPPRQAPSAIPLNARLLGAVPPCRVCPACIQDAQLITRVAALPQVTHCPQHRVRFCSHCSCGAPLAWFGSTNKPFTCQRCQLEWAHLPLGSAGETTWQRDMRLLALYEMLLGAPLFFQDDMKDSALADALPSAPSSSVSSVPSMSAPTLSDALSDAIAIGSFERTTPVGTRRSVADEHAIGGVMWTAPESLICIRGIAHQSGLRVSPFPGPDRKTQPRWLYNNLSVEALVSASMTMGITPSDLLRWRELREQQLRQEYGEPTDTQRGRESGDWEPAAPPGVQSVSCPNHACRCYGGAGLNNVRRYGMRCGQMEHFCSACGTRFIGSRLIVTFDEDHGSTTFRPAALARAQARLKRWTTALHAVCREMLDRDEVISLHAAFARASIPRSVNLRAEHLGLRSIVEQAFALQLQRRQEQCEQHSPGDVAADTTRWARRYRRSPKHIFRITPIDGPTMSERSEVGGGLREPGADASE